MVIFCKCCQRPLLESETLNGSNSFSVDYCKNCWFFLNIQLLFNFFKKNKIQKFIIFYLMVLTHFWYSFFFSLRYYFYKIIVQLKFKLYLICWLKFSFYFNYHFVIVYTWYFLLLLGLNARILHDFQLCLSVNFCTSPL